MARKDKILLYEKKPQVPKFAAGDQIRIKRWQIPSAIVKDIKLQDGQFYYYFDYTEPSGLELCCLEGFIETADVPVGRDTIAHLVRLSKPIYEVISGLRGLVC